MYVWSIDPVGMMVAAGALLIAAGVLAVVAAGRRPPS